MKKILKKIYHAVKQKLILIKTKRNWVNVKSELQRSNSNKAFKTKSKTATHKVLIYPSDLSTIIGALGDDAMITASLDQLKKSHDSLEVYMLCKSTAASVVESLGYQPIVFPNINLESHPDFFKNLYENEGFEYLIVLGADIMDGYYGITHPASALIAADLAVTSNIKPVILGFSFNKEPNEELAEFYNLLDRKITLNVRDDISLERIRHFSDANSILVADVAFCLTPTVVPSDIKFWIDAQKNNGNQIIGFNLHPMLLKNASKENINIIVQSAVHSIKKISKSSKVSFLLLPHDYRGNNGDSICLEPIYEQIIKDSNVNAYLLLGKHRASVLKAISGLLDGVVTGRMHLAIASLGMQTPTMCITYQDKFEGLFRHFSLPSKLLLAPQNMMNKDTFANELADFIGELSNLKTKVVAQSPHVKALSENNFSNIK